MRFKDLFIDFDDTIYDTHGNAVIALQEFFEHYGLGRFFAEPDVFYDAFWSANYELWHQYALGQIDRPYLMVERIRRPLAAGIQADGTPYAPTPAQCMEMSDKYLNLCADKPGTVDGAHQLLEYLKRRGYRIHLCSNGFHEVQYRKLRASDTLRYFDTIILSEDAGANKPQQAFFDYAMKTAHADRETTIMIGDNYETDIRGAKQAGLHTIFFNNNHAWQVDATDADYEVYALDAIKELL